MIMKNLSELYRKDFPVLSKTIGDKTLVYLDSTATTQKPQVVIDSQIDFLSKEYSSVKRGVYQLSEITTQKFEKTRRVVKEFIGASREEEVIFTAGTTDSINLVAQTWGRKNIQEGDEIILSQIEHHANIVPWQMLAEEKKALIKVIPCDDKGNLLLDEYVKLLNEKTKFVGVVHIANSIGTLNDVEYIVREAKKFNAITLVDGAQSIAHQKIDVQKIGCDFFVFSGHKVFAPTGVGVLYGRYKLLEIMPPWRGGGDMIEQVSFSGTTYAPPPAKFEAGTPAIAEVIGLGVALEYLNDIGIEEIAAYETYIHLFAKSELQKIEGLRFIGEATHQTSVISFVLDGIHAHDTAMILDEEAIAVRSGHHCAQPVMERFNVAATTRASFAFYNNEDDIHRLVKAIKRVQKIFS